MMKDGERDETKIGMPERGSAPRARNRTVMLTPELTNQMRLRISDETQPTTNASEVNAGRGVGGPNAGFERPGAGLFGGIQGRNLPGAGEPHGVGSAEFQSLKTDPTQRSSFPQQSSPFARTAVSEPPPGGGGVHPGWGAPIADSKIPTAATEAVPQYLAEPNGTGQPEVPVATTEVRPAEAHVGGVAENHHPVSANEQHGDSVVWSKLTPIVGFLVTYDKDPNGEWFELRTGRLSVSGLSDGSAGGRNAGSALLLSHESVSQNHAIMKIGTEGLIEVLDHLSEEGTRAYLVHENRMCELSGEKCVLQHSDVIEFGARRFRVFLNPLDPMGDDVA